MHSATHCALLQAKNARYLPQREADQVLQNEGDAELIGKPSNLPFKPLEGFGSDLCLHRVGLVISNNSDQAIAERKQRLQRSDVLRLSRFLPVHPLAGICGNPEQPRLRVGISSKLAPRPERL